MVCVNHHIHSVLGSLSFFIRLLKPIFASYKIIILQAAKGDFCNNSIAIYYK